MKIIFATGNAGKMREIRDILKDADASVFSLKDLGLTSKAEETGETFGENAYIKVKEIYDLLHEDAAADISVLSHMAGPAVPPKEAGPQVIPEPGTASAGMEKDQAEDSAGSTMAAGVLSGDLSDIIIMADDSGLCIDYLNGGPGVHSARFMGHETSYEVKNAAIMDMLKDVPDKQRGAAFVCHICALTWDGRRFDTEAKMRGFISHASCGSGGFGYDPILYLPELDRTSGELTEDEKNSISHRGKGLRGMKELLINEGLLRLKQA